MNRVADADGNARYLGEIENRGTQVACNINLSINSYDAFGALLNNPGDRRFGFGDVLGESFRFSSFTPQTFENCISPGRRASFDIRTDVRLDRVASIAVDIPCGHESLYAGCLGQDQPFFPPTPDLVLAAPMVEGVSSDGRLVYSGLVQNQSPVGTATAYHVKIVITAYNAQGIVADVACAAMDGPTCPLPAGMASSTGLAPGALWPFAVTMSIPPSAACQGCVSAVINRRISQ